MAKQIRSARHYQQRSDPLRRLADRAIPGVKSGILDALKGLSGLVPEAANRHAAAGDWSSVKNSIGWQHFRGVLRGAFGQIGKARESGARLGEKQINAAFAQAGRSVRFRKYSPNQPRNARGRWVSEGGEGYLRLRKDGDVLDVLFDKDANDQYAFDLYSQDVQDELRAAQDDLIAELEQEARDAIDQIVLNGARLGLVPEDIMDDVRSYIGLTARQSQAVQNYRDMLESLDPGALDRQLRNFLEDDTVQAALDAGQPMSDAMVDKLVDDYTENFLDYRAETIAQTEATRAVSLGLQDSYAQAIDNGVFPSDAVTQYWKVDLDERTCPVCLSIPDMNPDGVSMDEAFDSVDGPMDAPPDPHPNCRCSIEIVTNLDMLDSGDTSSEEAA